MQINIGDHQSTEPTFMPVPTQFRAQLYWARTRLNTIARTIPGANVYFRRLDGGRSLTQVLADRSIWVNYTISLDSDLGGTAPGNKEIGVGPAAFSVGRWTVLATLIHELAHCNGAPGRNSYAAEDAVLACGLGKQSEWRTGVDDPYTPYKPGLHG